MADENPQSNIPKKETVRITMPPVKQASDSQAIKRETISLEGVEAARHTMRIPSAGESARMTSPLPTAQATGGEPKRESTRVPAPVVPGKPFTPPPPPAGLRPPSPGIKPPGAPVAPPKAPAAPTAAAISSSKPVQRTTRVPAPQRPLPQATVKLAPAPAPAAAPSQTIRTSTATVTSEAPDQLTTILTWVGALVAVAAAVMVYLANSTF